MPGRKSKASKQLKQPLPPIPEKVYFTIGEVGRLCYLQPHVLRYWEQEFTQLAPGKRRNRRYYQKKDVLLIRTIRSLLYEQGYTIDGARHRLDEMTARKSTLVPKQSILEAIEAMDADLQTVLQE